MGVFVLKRVWAVLITCQISWINFQSIQDMSEFLKVLNLPICSLTLFYCTYYSLNFTKGFFFLLTLTYGQNIVLHN